MKILQINSVCGIGSTGRIATDIHNILIQQGKESYIAYGRDKPKKCENTIKIGNKYDNYAHVIKTRIFDGHGFGSKQATIEFIEKVKELNPDIIHLHNIHGYYINVEILFDYLKEVNKPVIWTLHDCWSFTGHCSYFDYVSCYKWKTECFGCPQKREYPSSLMFDNSKRNYNKKRKIFTGIKNLTVITPSEWLANLVKKSYLKEYPIKVINNGIDLNIFKPVQNNFRQKHNLDDKFIILGVASTWDRRKGLKYFIEMSNKLNDKEAIVLVGLSEKQLKEIPKKIIGISRTNNAEELAEIYSSADVFVNPTLEEVLGMTNIEALACGTPVITFNSGGSPETINSATGLVVGKSVDEIITGINCIKKSSWKTDCIKRAKLYGKNKQFNYYIDTYKLALNDKENYTL